jgi:hypothetical protein
VDNSTPGVLESVAGALLEGDGGPEVLWLPAVLFPV